MSTVRLRYSSRRSIEGHRRARQNTVGRGPQRDPPRGTLATDAHDVLTSHGLIPAPVRIGHRTAFVHSVIAGLGVQEYEPRGKGFSRNRPALRMDPPRGEATGPPRGNLIMGKARLTELSKKFAAPTTGRGRDPEPAPAPAPTTVAPARRGRTGITTFLAEEAHRQLRQLALGRTTVRPETDHRSDQRPLPEIQPAAHRRLTLGLAPRPDRTRLSCKRLENP